MSLIPSLVNFSYRKYENHYTSQYNLMNAELAPKYYTMYTFSSNKISLSVYVCESTYKPSSFTAGFVVLGFKKV